MAAIIAQITRAKRERDKKKTYHTEKCMWVTLYIWLYIYILWVTLYIWLYIYKLWVSNIFIPLNQTHHHHNNDTRETMFSPGSMYLVPGTLYQVHCTWYNVDGREMFSPGTTCLPLTHTLTRQCTTSSWQGAVNFFNICLVNIQIFIICSKKSNGIVTQEGMGEGKGAGEARDWGASQVFLLHM